MLANNPELNADQRSIVEQDLDELTEFIDRASSTKYIVGAMVQVVDVYDYAFMGTWRYDQARLLKDSVN